MTDPQDDSFREMLIKLEILGDEGIDKARARQMEEAAKGKTVPLAVAVAQSGLLPYGLVERILSHIARETLVCEGCKNESSAGDLDPRVPFRCSACDSALVSSQVSGEMSVLDTMVRDSETNDSEEGEDLTGRVLGGCRLDRKIGEGGMGAVYEATQIFLDRKVAVKILPEHHVRRKGFVDRFLRESRSAAKIVHPNVVQVHDAGREGQTYYIIMEYVEGKSLHGVLREEGRVSVERAVNLARQAAQGLAAAAKHGIIHRDIKPDNIRLTADGVAKVADFGLAKDLESAENLTMEGAVVGTPLYMSPEQAKGETADFRTDIYSLGATMYHLIAGEPPFQGPSAVAILQKHTSEEIKPLGGEVGGLVSRMMAKDPGKRFDSYDNLIRAMEGIGGEQDWESETIESAAVRVESPRRRSRVPLVLGVVVLLIAVVGGVFLIPSGASLEISSVPAGARVLFDGVEMGITPLIIDDPPRKAGILRLEVEGYKPHEEELDLSSGDAVTRQVEMRVLPSRARVVTTPVEGATVYVDGTARGTTPLEMDDLAAGLHVVEVKLEGYRPTREEVRLKPGEDRDVSITLDPIFPKVSIVTTPPGAEVMINGVSKGKTPLEFDDLPPGKYSFDLVLPLHVSRNFLWDLKPGQVARHETEMVRPHKVRIFLEAIGEARALLDGGKPLRASDRLARTIDEIGVQEELSKDEEIVYQRLRADLGERVPKYSLEIRLADETVAGRASLRSDSATPAKGRGHEVVYSPSDAWVGRFALVGGDMVRLPPGEGSLSFPPGKTEVLLYILVVGGGDVDALAGEEMEASRMYPGGWGADLVRRLRKALQGREEDFALQAAWIDERP